MKAFGLLHVKRILLFNYKCLPRPAPCAQERMALYSLTTEKIGLVSQNSSGYQRFSFR